MSSVLLIVFSSSVLHPCCNLLVNFYWLHLCRFFFSFTLPGFHKQGFYAVLIHMCYTYLLHTSIQNLSLCIYLHFAFLHFSPVDLFIWWATIWQYVISIKQFWCWTLRILYVIYLFSVWIVHVTCWDQTCSQELSNSLECILFN